MGLRSDCPGAWFSLYVSRPEQGSITYATTDRHSTLQAALDQVNDLASEFAEMSAYPRPNAIDVTRQHWERALAAHPHNPSGRDAEGRTLDERVAVASERFEALYARYGGWRHYGRPDGTDPAGYAGPLFWQEEDVRFRLALELEREFPAAVHLNSLMSPATVRGWEQAVDGRHQYADVLVDDLRGFDAGNDALRAFAERPATLLVEIKFIRRRRQGRDVPRDVNGIFGDAMRLGRHLRLGRTARAVMVVVDDEDHFLDARESMPWPAGVTLLRVGPPREALSMPRPWGVSPSDGLPGRWSGASWETPSGYFASNA